MRSGYLGILGVLVLSACGSPAGSQTLEIVRTLPHDTTASTQGLLLYQGKFYESTGQYGESTLREVDVETGEVLKMIRLPDEYFGEGLARVDDELIQLTWHAGLAFVYDINTFEKLRTIEYQGEGWGLCYDGEALYMTNGSAILHRRDPRTLEVLESHEVTFDNEPVRSLNELACVGDVVYANVYQSDRILKIDKHTGHVLAQFDGSVLVPEGGRPRNVGAVLNGITYDPDHGTFYVTGKRWPTMFEVRF